MYVLDKKPLRKPPSNASEIELAKLEKWWDHDLQAKSYTLASMSNELKRRFEKTVNAADVHLYLKELYGVQTRSKKHATIKEFMNTRLRDETLAHEHGVRMIGPFEKLVGHDVIISSEISIDILLLSLPLSFDGSMVNFNMNKLEATLEELVNMLTIYEATIKKKSMFLWCTRRSVRKGAQNRGKRHYAPPKKNRPNKKPYNKPTQGLTNPDKP
ncbi:uncharacterized protein [Primulina eburnea]|uniref:uncharacterized protein n=1 Tax=Primulina eburnea TaxID=1245227 RepID=UPI003C6C9654